MISYEPFFNTLKEKNMSKYQLIFYWGISSNTLRRMSHNEAISTTTLNELCLILDCQVQDIIRFDVTQEELQQLEEQKQEIANTKNKPKTFQKKCQGLILISLTYFF